MKHRVLTSILVGGFLISTTTAFAQSVAPTTKPSSAAISITPTAGPSPTLSAEDKKVEDFKQNIAKVAESRKKDQKATAGVITSVSSDRVVINTALGTPTTIKLDATLTKAYQITGSQKKEIKQSDLKKGMYIIVSGVLLAVDKAIDANVIYVDEQIFVKSGKIVEVNADEAFLRVLTSERDTITLDIPAGQRMQIMNSDTLEMAATTFSKVKEGDTIQFVYVKTGKEKLANRYDSMKVLVVPQEYFQKTEKKG